MVFVQNSNISPDILGLIIISLLLVLASCGISVNTNGEINAVNAVLDILLLLYIFLMISLLYFQLFVVSFAAMKAYNGEHYCYLWTMKVIQ